MAHRKLESSSFWRDLKQFMAFMEEPNRPMGVGGVIDVIHRKESVAFRAVTYIGF